MVLKYCDIVLEKRGRIIRMMHEMLENVKPRKPQKKIPIMGTLLQYEKQVQADQVKKPQRE